jgi:hypothetical protein
VFCIYLVFFFVFVIVFVIVIVIVYILLPHSQDHQDQTLRGQAALFVAKMIAQEAAFSALGSFELAAIDFSVPSFIEKLLRLVHTDGSSITAKMACHGVVSW